MKTAVDEDHSAAKSARSSHRVKFHREDLKNKFSLHRHGKAAGGRSDQQIDSSTNDDQLASHTPAPVQESLLAADQLLMYSTPEAGLNTEERTRWFKKIFKHNRHQPAGGAAAPAIDSSSSAASSSVSFLSAVEYDEDDEDDDDEEREEFDSDAHAARVNDALSCSSAASSLTSVWSAKTCAPSMSLELMNRQESSSPPRTMRRFKTKFRLRKGSNASSASSCVASDSSSTPQVVPGLNRKLTRASSTGTLASNCGAMSRRSYRIKLDHALQKAHLRRRNFGLTTDLASDYSAIGGSGGVVSASSGQMRAEDRSGFMMAPDINDATKTHSAELYQSVVVEAQMPS